MNSISLENEKSTCAKPASRVAVIATVAGFGSGFDSVATSCDRIDRGCGPHGFRRQGIFRAQRMNIDQADHLRDGGREIPIEQQLVLEARPVSPGERPRTSWASSLARAISASATSMYSITQPPRLTVLIAL